MQIKDSREQEDTNFAAAELHNSKILYDIFQARLMQTALVGHQACGWPGSSKGLTEALADSNVRLHGQTA